MTDQQHNNDDDKVGPGRPPREYRFKKGQPSPNPLGRPPKPKKVDGLLAKLDPWAAAVVKFDNTIIGRASRGGEMVDLSRRDHWLELLYKRIGKDDVWATKYYKELTDAAHAKASSYKQDILGGAVAHREKYLKTFIQYEAAGRALPDIYPDPRDVIIDENGNVTIEGPTDFADRAFQDLLVEQQQAVLTVIESIGRETTEAKAASSISIIRKLKRRLSRINKALPSRLRATRLPDSDDDEE